VDFDKNYNGGAEFFVAMGVLSMLYSLGCLPIYMVFLNDQWGYSEWIANIVSWVHSFYERFRKNFSQDFIASVTFSLVYLIADIVWSAQTASLKNYIDDELESISVCLLNAVCISETIHSTDSFLQLDISLVRNTYNLFVTLYSNSEWTSLQVFGWLTMVIWVASLWFLFKDTTFFNDPKAPWAKKTDPSSGVQQNPIQGEADNQNGNP